MYLVDSAGGLELTLRSTTQQQQRIDRSMRRISVQEF